MEKNDFARVDDQDRWWLTRSDSDLTADVAAAREQVRDELGFDNDWYTVQAKLEELYDLLERQDAQLLHDLDDLVGESDVGKLVDWLILVAQAVKPEPVQAPAAPTSAEEAPAAPSAAEPATARAGDAQPATSAAEPPSASAEPPAASAEPPAASAEPPSAAAEPPAAAAEPPAAAAKWDPEWGMFIRYVDGNYQYALSAVLADGPKTETPAGVPDGTWYPDQNSAAAARQGNAALKTQVTDLFNDSANPLEPEQLAEALADPQVAEALAAAQRDLEEMA